LNTVAKLAAGRNHAGSVGVPGSVAVLRRLRVQDSRASAGIGPEREHASDYPAVRVLLIPSGINRFPVIPSGNIPT
jgi:hypothetical protein